jgi:monofunctional biosynthetic peptidoglycan transglycosylase
MFKKFLRIFGKIALYFFASSIIAVIVFRFVPVPVTPLMIIRSVLQIAAGESPKILKDWVSYNEISDNMKLAVIASEDQKFFKHNGFDIEAIQKAFEKNKKKKRIKGASTISQQTAKNVFLWPARSWVRKGFEVYFTFLIELVWNKERILEVYLNVIEMGDGIYGTEAAAQTYFKKSAEKLSASQAAMIAACLPNPRKFKVNKPSGYIFKRQSWIVRQIKNIGGLPEPKK